MRRRPFLLLVSLTCIGTLTAWVLREPAPGPTRANFERLHAEMTLEEIEAIMGRPADRSYYMTMSMTYIWGGKDGLVSIRSGFGMSGELYTNGKILTLAAAPEPFFHKLRRWLGL